MRELPNSRFPARSAWALVDRFIPPDLMNYDHQEAVYKARVLILVQVLTLVTFGLPALGILFHREKLEQFNFLPWLCLLIPALLFITVWRFQRTGSFAFAANLYGFAATLAVLCLIFVSGGFDQALVLPHWPLIIIFIFIMTGFKAAVFWAFVGLVLWLGGLATLNQGLPLLIDPQLMPAGHALSVVVAMVNLLGVLWFFSFYQNHLLNRLQVERDRALFSAAHDSLTGLANRNTFELRLQNLIANYKVVKGVHAVLIIDLDGFKPINDTIGHQTGDMVLTTIGRRIKQQIRRSDLAARIGGDEFSVLLCDVRHVKDLEPILSKLHQSITAPIRLDDGQVIAVGASIGVALLGADGDQMESVLHNADQAMYRAKACNHAYCFHNDGGINND